MTVIQLEPHRTACLARIQAVMSVYYELYDAREEGSTVRRDLETHEALFLSACNSIGREAEKERRDGEKVWGYGTNAYAALVNLSFRQEAEKMEAALEAYKRLQEAFESGADVEEAVSHAIAAE